MMERFVEMIDRHASLPSCPTTLEMIKFSKTADFNPLLTIVLDQLQYIGVTVRVSNVCY